MDLLGSLMKAAGPALSASTPSRGDSDDKSAMLGVIFGSAAPTVERMLESKHSGRVIGVSALAAGAFLLPKLLGAPK